MVIKFAFHGYIWNWILWVLAMESKYTQNILKFALCNFIGKTLKPSRISGNCNIKTSPYFRYIGLFKRPSSFWNPCVEGPFWVCCGKLRTLRSDWVIMSTHLRLGRETAWVSLLNILFVLLKQFPFLYQSLEMDSCKICDVIFCDAVNVFYFHLSSRWYPAKRALPAMLTHGR